MSNALELAIATPVIDRGSGLAVQQLQQRMDIILSVMANVLEEGKDYGKIPGTDKPTLYKSGAEKLMLAFNLAAGQPQIEDISTSDEIRYRVGVPIESTDGRPRWGVGEASSNEEKYRWRKPVCQEEFDETPDHLKREKWFRGKSPYKGLQVRTSPADVANTILKMAHKRGFIHGTLLATGASSVFNQDLEDFTKEMQASILETDPTVVAAPSRPPAAAQRTSARPATNGNGLVTDARKVKDVRVFGKDKNNYAVCLSGDPTEYTTKDAAVAAEFEAFKGTDHLIRIRYEDNEWQGKTYHNLKSFSIDDVAIPSPSPSIDVVPNHALDIEPAVNPNRELGIIVEVIDRGQAALVKLNTGFQCATANPQLIETANDLRISKRRVELITTAPSNPKYARRLVELNILTDEVQA